MKSPTKTKPYQISYKHEINDIVYFLYMNTVHKSRINNVIIKKDRKATDIWYIITKNPCGKMHPKTFREDELFSTKEELLSSL